MDADLVIWACVEPDLLYVLLPPHEKLLLIELQPTRFEIHILNIVNTKPRSLLQAFQNYAPVHSRSAKSPKKTSKSDYDPQDQSTSKPE